MNTDERLYALRVYSRIDVHVYATNVDVIRAVRGLMKPKDRRRNAMRDMRKKLYRDVLTVHADARRMYAEIMRGEYHHVR